MSIFARILSLAIAACGLLAVPAAHAQGSLTSWRNEDEALKEQQVNIKKGEDVLARAQRICDPLWFEQARAQFLRFLEVSARQLEAATGAGPAAATITTQLRAEAAIYRAEITKIRALKYKPCGELSDDEIIPVNSMAALFAGAGTYGNHYEDYYFEVADDEFENRTPCDRKEFDKQKQELINYLDERASYLQWHLFPKAKVSKDYAKTLTKKLDQIRKRKERIDAIQFKPCDDKQAQNGEEQLQLQEGAGKPAHKGEEQHQQQEGGGEQQQQQEQQQQAAEEGRKTSLLPGRIHFDISTNATVGHATGKKHGFLALELGGQLSLGAIEYTPEGTETGLELGGRVGILDATAPTPRDRIFFAFSVFQKSYSDSQSLGELDPAGANLGIPGPGDPGGVFPAGVLLAPAAVTGIEAHFDSEATGASFLIGTELSLSPRISISPSIGFQWTGIDQTIGFSGDVPSYTTALSYDTDISSHRKSAVVSAEIAYKPDSPVGQFMVEYYVAPTLYLDFLDYSGTDRFNLSGFLNDSQSVDFNGSDTGIGGAIRFGIELRPPSVPAIFYAGVSAERRLNDVSVFRSGQTGEQSIGEPGYQSDITAGVGMKFTL